LPRKHAVWLQASSTFNAPSSAEWLKVLYPHFSFHVQPFLGKMVRTKQTRRKRMHVLLCCDAAILQLQTGVPFGAGKRLQGMKGESLTDVHVKLANQDQPTLNLMKNDMPSQGFGLTLGFCHACRIFPGGSSACTLATKNGTPIARGGGGHQPGCRPSAVTEGAGWKLEARDCSLVAVGQAPTPA